MGGLKEALSLEGAEPLKEWCPEPQTMHEAAKLQFEFLEIAGNSESCCMLKAIDVRT